MLMSKRSAMALMGVVGILLGMLISSQTGMLSAQDAKGPKWLHAHELRVRKAGESDFTKDTKKWSIEVFKDENNGNLIYICESGSIAVVKP